MIVRILGSAAGGGFPQWNCLCPNCRGIRSGSLKFIERTQSSIAISSDGERWVICNTSPDIHRQLALIPASSRSSEPRSLPVAAVMLVDAQIDHATGLLLLRENRAPLEIWTSAAVQQDLTTGLPFLSVLESYCRIEWHEIPVDSLGFSLDALPGITIRGLSVAGKPPPYSPHREQPRLGDNLALAFTDERIGKTLLYAPGLAEVTPPIAEAMRGSACLLVDGTFWSDDEMIALGVSQKTARSIGHLPQSGPRGMIEQLARLPPSIRRILIHINNTNPILVEDGPERAALETAGIEVAYDGMEIRL